MMTYSREVRSVLVADADRPSGRQPVLSDPKTAGWLLGLLGSTILATGMALPAVAADHPAPAMVAQAPAGQTFAIAAQPLRQALARYTEQSGIAVSLPADIAPGLTSAAVDGRYSPDEALRRLLTGTGLTFDLADGQAVVRGTAEIPADGDTTVLDPITVFGIGATENTGSYSAPTASTATKLPTSLRQTPRSVTVLTDQFIQDQNITSLEDALVEVLGVTFKNNSDSGLRNDTIIRGFPVDGLQVDGVNVGRSNDVTSLFDFAIYDRLEVERGAAGLFRGAGEPGGIANIVRRRAPSAFQFNGSASVGSWASFRLVGDVGGPLFGTDRVRGRVIAAYDNRESFVDLVESERVTIFGTVDIDLTEQTVLTLGATFLDGDGREARGLPAFADGTLLDVPRSTFIGADWNSTEQRNWDIFAGLQHSFDNGVTVDLRGSYLNRRTRFRYAYANTAVDEVTGETGLRADDNVDEQDEFSLDAYTTIPLQLFDQSHTLLFGADFFTSDYDRSLGRAGGGTINVFDPNNDIPEPDFVIDRFEDTRITQYGLYGTAQIKPTDWSTLILGGRVSFWEVDTTTRNGDETTNFTNEVDGKFTPSAALLLDLTDNLSVYGSWASIFVPQDNLQADGSIVDPREGEQFEVGINGSFFDDALFARLAAFQIVDENRAIDDPDDPDFSVAAGEVTVQGVEAEVSGEILPNWSISGGYAFLLSEFTDDPNNEGESFQPLVPRHSFQLRTKYTFDEGLLDGVNLRAGLTAVSSFFGEPGDVRVRQSGYATVDLGAGYEITENLQVDFTVANVFDTEYYASVQSPRRQNYYGSPRSFLLNVRATW